MKASITPYIYTLFFFCAIPQLFCQEFELKLTSLDSLEQIVLNSLNPSQKFNSKIEIEDAAKGINNHLRSIGFFESTFDSIKKLDSLTYNSFHSLGKKMDSIVISFDPEIREIIEVFTNSKNNSFTLTLTELEPTLQRLSNYFEGQGEPFTTVKLSNITSKENLLKSDLIINRTKERTIDRIVIGGYKNFPRSYIKHYADLKIGNSFNKEKINEASKAINSLNFVSESKEPQILFTKDSTIVYLYLKKQRANQFDGIIGFSSSQTDKLEFDGYLDLQLNNALNKGEQLSIQWKSNADDRKQFDAFLTLPYLFKSPISPEINFNLYKQDSTFINIKTRINLNYTITPEHHIAASYFSENSNDLDNLNSELEVFNFKTKLFGGQYTFKQFSKNNLLLHKTYIEANGLFGNKKNTDNKTTLSQQQYTFKGFYNWRLNRRNFIFIQNQNGILLSDELYNNELFRIGGTNTIRGFNEESIFCSSFIVLNLEYRYQLSTSSLLYSITDIGRVENNINDLKSTLYSFGLGYKYILKNGLVDLSYALGKDENTAFNIQNTKFHIKLTQFF